MRNVHHESMNVDARQILTALKPLGIHGIDFRSKFNAMHKNE